MGKIMKQGMIKSEMYLELLKNVLTDMHHVEYEEFMSVEQCRRKSILKFINKILLKKGLSICKKINSTKEDRINGKDWPMYADTMIGIKRLNNIEQCFLEIIKNNIEGDLIETGVWRGGATIFMRALLKVYNINDKVVWVADSFAGLPKSDEKKYTMDKGDKHYTKKQLVVSLDQVKNNFSKYGLLDNQVKFLKGFFKNTLPNAPIQKLSLLRLDGDMYESTMDALTNLYSKLSVGGFIIIDDWNSVKGCKMAVEDFRKENRIKDEIVEIDWASIYWKKLQE